MINRQRIHDKKRRIQRLRRIFVDEYTNAEDIITDLYGRQCSCWMCSYKHEKKKRCKMKAKFRRDIREGRYK